MENLKEPLCHDSENQPLEDFTRTGGLLVAVAHIITAVIGAGVLSLSWSFAQLGWIAGPLVILFFAFVTIYSSFLMCDCYMFCDPVAGPVRNRTYQDAVQAYLGEANAAACALMQHINFYGTGVAYTITTPICMRAIQQSNCYHKYGHDSPCEYSTSMFMVIFGIVQLFLSQIPNIDKLWWISILATIMSFSYSSIGLGLGISKVIENGEFKGSVEGIIGESSSFSFHTFSLISQAFGDIAFAFPYTYLVLEIQDTLKSPPAVEKTMKKASTVSVIATTFFYMLCATFGYGAFGSDAPGNILTGFGFYEPYWLVDFANACVAVHLVGAYQVYSQPLFSFGESLATKKWPNNRFINSKWTFYVPLLGQFNLSLLRLCWRSAYVISTTVIAIALPYFNTVLAILGVICFWPLTIYFPFKMHVVQKNIQCWSLKWIVLNTLSFLCLLLSIMAAIGSIDGIL